MTDTYTENVRDRVAITLCNFILNTIATKYYRLFVKNSIEYGMRSAARDTIKNQTTPGDWRDRNVRSMWKDESA